MMKLGLHWTILPQKAYTYSIHTLKLHLLKAASSSPSAPTKKIRTLEFPATMSGSSPALPPGFRFHPTDEELILHYLCKRAAAAPCPVAIIADINIYKFNPWDLPAKAKFGETEWYFFSPRDRKYPNGVRPNRAAASGYWKATGTDKPIRIGSSGNENIGVKKALVFYKGKPPKSVKTNWIMHEYRLANALHNSNQKLTDASMRLDDWVLCRIYQKSSCHKSQVGREKEDSTEEHAELQNQTSRNMIHRSFSLSELLMEETDFSLLSRLLESPTDAPLTDHAPLSNLNYSNGSYLNSQVWQSDASLLTADCSLKRHRAVDNYYFDECGGHLNHFKKLSSSHNSAQFDNLFDMSQPFFTQQLLLNSDHLGMN